MSPSKRPLLLYLLGIGSVVAAAIAVVLLFVSRSSLAKSEAAARQAALQAGPRIRVLKAKLSGGTGKFEREAEARPFASVTLYAKVSGYLKEVRVDRGDAVKANQVIALIESPELDRQYEGAVADARNKQTIYQRTQKLMPSGVVSEQEADVARANAQMAQATLDALKTQKSYQVLRAPFDGTVTARFADPGALIQSAASSQTSAMPVVNVSQIDRLRVYVYLDPRAAASVQVGDAAQVRAAERPGVVKKGSVTRLSRELDPKSKTMLAEIDLDNADQAIIPGSYVSVMLELATPRWVEIPAEALVFRGAEPFVAVLDGEQRLRYRPVKLADQDGRKAQLLAGLSEGETVALNVGDTVADGDKVQPVPADAPAAPSKR